MILGQHLRMLPQHLRHVQQQVTEIGRVQRRQPRLVGGVERLGLPAGEIRILRRGDARGGEPAVLPALHHPHQRVRRPTLRVDPPGLHHLLQQAELVVGVQNGEVGLQPRQVGVPPQHPGAQRVERAEP